MPALLAGFVTTLVLAVAAAPLALLLALPLAGLRLAGLLPLRAAALGYIELMRDTPLLVQMYLIYFGLPLLGLFPSEFTCGVAAIALQHAAFFAEIYRGGLQAVSPRQWEAARAIGMRRRTALRVIVLPQALMRILGPLGNQLIVLVKDTSIVSAIGVVELTMSGKMVIERTAASADVFVAVALLYFVLTVLLGGAVRLAERRAVARM